MTQDVTSDSSGAFDLYGERISVVVLSRRHRQANHKPGAFVEFPRRENNERVHVLHLAAGLWVAINPDHVTALRAPRLPGGHQRASMPTGAVAMASPPCSAGSNAANFCASVSFGSPIALTS